MLNSSNHQLHEQESLNSQQIIHEDMLQSANQNNLNNLLMANSVELRPASLTN